jgi:predicted DNA-binding transcriptional regulator YafY
MATNKHAQIRYLALNKCFSNHGRRYYIVDLVAACNEAIRDFSMKDDGVKKRQVYEDIKFMESERGWSANIEKIRDGKQVYYRYKDKHYSINQSPLSQIELTQINEVIFTLSRFTGMPQFEWVSEISAKLQNLHINRHNGNNRIIDFEQNQYLKGLEHVTTFFNAIHHQRTLNVNYAPFNRKNKIEYIFHAYHLKQYNQRWFVFGLTGTQHQLTNLALDRILSATESQIPYIPNSKFDFTEYFDDIIGVTLPENGLIETVILSVKKDFLPYLETKPLHGSQTSLKSNKDENLLSFKLIINYELISKLLSLGTSIKVLKPAHLVQSIKKQIQTMALNY